MAEFQEHQFSCSKCKILYTDHLPMGVAVRRFCAYVKTMCCPRCRGRKTVYLVTNVEALVKEGYEITNG
jgi:hypothetical protein